MEIHVTNSSIVTAAAYPENYTHDLSGVNSTGVRPLRPSEVEAMYPMSAEAEAAIVHVIPMVPVNVDGTWYKAEEITLFNGQRLHFTEDKGGSLFAFTDAKSMDNGNYYVLGTQGSKEALALSFHVRAYAANADSSYHPSLGYYVIGTSHVDFPPYFGWSEDAAHGAAIQAAETLGWDGIYEDSWWMFNQEEYRWVGVNFIQNDGLADFVYVP
ncbi:hypothetical protein DGWBC_0577 [Dehalogenimonas sp. WBC-2]|nr:hypothetical protein DGWBC_0577 [Dehalogenimonas sp. WBC-2]